MPAEPRVRTSPSDPSPGDVTFEARILTASRALVGIAARSLADLETDVTLQQYRALVLLAQFGERRMTELANALAIHPSTTSRLCDRLAAKGLIDRGPAQDSRREVVVGLTVTGRTVIDSVTKARQREIASIASKIPAGERAGLLHAFEIFATAAGELPDEAWKLGWS